MFRLKSCPRCKGDVWFDRDEYGWYELCLQCGNLRDLPSVAQAKQEHPEKEKELGRTRRGRGQV